MSQAVIKVDNLSKQYRLGTIGTGTIGHDLNRWWAKVRGQEDPTLKIDAQTLSTSIDYVWALKDINFDIRQGEILGIIGKNGAGKSTLLKILSKITAPTTGKVKIKGRIASLLEVGTGFHPELTGRENIFLNGAILGMTKTEIKSKFDEIVDFSGVEKYIDTPVKRYSSGMYVRLAFAVAAHLEPEILIIDEVLAVGDVEFQKKCLGKMKDVSDKDGRTVLFVSHNMAAIQKLCQKGMFLQNGAVSYIGDCDKTITKYLESNKIEDVPIKERKDRQGDGKIKIVGIEIRNQQNQPIYDILAGSTVDILMHYEKNTTENLKVIPGIFLKNINDIQILTLHSRLNGKVYTDLPATGTFILRIKNLLLTPSVYSLGYSLITDGEYNDSLSNAIDLNVINSNFYGNAEIPPASHGFFLMKNEWLLNTNSNV